MIAFEFIIFQQGYVFMFHDTLRIQICPEISGFPYKSYNPTLGMGMRPSILLRGGVWILRDS